MKILFAVVVFILVNNDIKAFDEKEIHKRISYLVYTDDWNFSTNDSVKDVVVSNYKITELNSYQISKAVCRIYKISTSDSCNCFYYVAVDQSTNEKIYRIKGFKSSEFMYFFNDVLINECSVSVYGYKRDTMKKRRKCIVKNFKIENLDLRELYVNYYNNTKLNRLFYCDKFSCWDKNISYAY